MLTPVCKNQRIQRHKSLKQIATLQWGGSMDVSCMCWWMLKGNLFKRNSRMGISQMQRFYQSLAQSYMGKLFGDRGYISETLKV